MPNVILQRLCEIGGETYGVLMVAEQPGPGPMVEGRPRCVTLELGWRDNRPRISCVPVGTYLCRYVDSPKFGFTYRLEGVPGRSEILFHWGNSHEDTLGCILVGTSFNMEEDSSHIIGSKIAFRGLMKLLRPAKEFELTIKGIPL